MTRTTTPAAFSIRPISPDDREPLTRFYSALSADSVEARFHGALPTIPARTARFFCGPDHQHREGLVAETIAPGGAPEIIGHVCIEPITPDLAEVAIAVADAWQHHGVGRAMLAEAIDWGRTHGVGRLLASMRWSNSAMLELLRSTGQPMTFGDFGRRHHRRDPRRRDRDAARGLTRRRPIGGTPGVRDRARTPSARAGRRGRSTSDDDGRVGVARDVLRDAPGEEPFGGAKPAGSDDDRVEAAAEVCRLGEVAQPAVRSRIAASSSCAAAAHSVGASARRRAASCRISVPSSSSTAAAVDP